MVVELLVKAAEIDIDIGVFPEDDLHTFGGTDDVDQLDEFYTAFLEEADVG